MNAKILKPLFKTVAHPPSNMSCAEMERRRSLLCEEKHFAGFWGKKGFYLEPHNDILWYTHHIARGRNLTPLLFKRTIYTVICIQLATAALQKWRPCWFWAEKYITVDLMRVCCTLAVLNSSTSPEVSH